MLLWSPSSRARHVLGPLQSVLETINGTALMLAPKRITTRMTFDKEGLDKFLLKRIAGTEVQMAMPKSCQQSKWIIEKVESAELEEPNQFGHTHEAIVVVLRKDA